MSVGKFSIVVRATMNTQPLDVIDLRVGARVQNRSPYDVLLHHVDYFELKALQTL